MNLVEGVRKWLEHEGNAIIAHGDISAWGAPGECHEAVQTGIDKKEAELEEEYPFGDVIETLEYYISKDMGSGEGYLFYEKLLEKWLERNNPFY